MANVNIKFNGKEFLLSCDDGQEEHLEELSFYLNEKFISLKNSLGNIGENKLLLITTIQLIDEYFDLKEKITIQKSKLDQISSGLKEAKHGIFSYYLMKGLEGKADQNSDKKITNGELLDYMNEQVAMKAAELGRQQNPSLAGDPNKVLMSYR